MTTRVLLVRHGATVLTAEDRFAGATDVELSNEGRHQARALAERLADEKVHALYASPLGRTRETASILGVPHKLEPVIDPALREIDHGHWEGLSRREVEAAFPEEYSAWEQDPFSFAPKGGESGVAVMARALPAVRAIVQRHPDATVAIVSHKATIRLVLSHLLGVDARGYRDRLDQSPAALNIVDFRDAVRARLMLYNDTSHYADWPRRALGGLSKWWDPQA